MQGAALLEDCHSGQANQNRDEMSKNMTEVIYLKVYHKTQYIYTACDGFNRFLMKSFYSTDTLQLRYQLQYKYNCWCNGMRSRTQLSM